MARHIILGKLDNVSSGGSSATLTRTVASVLVTEANQKTFTIPMENFDKDKHFFDVRVGSTWFSDERYDIVNNTIVLKTDEEGIELGRKVFFVFFYLTKSDSSEQGSYSSIEINGEKVNMFNFVEQNGVLTGIEALGKSFNFPSSEYSLYINDNGELCIKYRDNSVPPKFSIDEQGNLKLDI